MIWDFADANPFSTSTGNWTSQVELIAKVIEKLSSNANCGEVHQADASNTIYADGGPVIVTDPPYYDNISYAELSDFFYVWLRPSAARYIPRPCSPVFLVPIQEEMIAAPRFDKVEGFNNARERFEEPDGQNAKIDTRTLFPRVPFVHILRLQATRGATWRCNHPQVGRRCSLRLVNADFRDNRHLANAYGDGGSDANCNWTANTLASSVILVCRPRPEDAPVATRRQFLNELERELPAALDHLTREGHIAPVDLAQAAIGPGMQVYSKYSRVETISGESVPVRDALIEINRVIAEYHLSEQGELDSASQFCVEWLQEYGYAEGEYGRAEVLALAKNVAIEAAPLNGLMSSGGNRAKLLRMNEFRHGPSALGWNDRMGGLHAYGVSSQRRTRARRGGSCRRSQRYGRL